MIVKFNENNRPVVKMFYKVKNKTWKGLFPTAEEIHEIDVLIDTGFTGTILVANNFLPLFQNSLLNPVWNNNINIKSYEGNLKGYKKRIEIWFKNNSNDLIFFKSDVYIAESIEKPYVIIWMELFKWLDSQILFDFLNNKFMIEFPVLNK